MKAFLSILLFAICIPLAGQTSYDELVFEPDSMVVPYKPVGKNVVFIRSKRGTSGLNKTPIADAILSAEITEIVLVFSEVDASAINSREDANRERWENLLMTYPEYFQFSTTYRNLCQCKMGGDAEAFKLTQGFYVYVNGEVPKIEEPKVAAAPPAAPTTPPTPANPAKTEQPVTPPKQEKQITKEETVAAVKEEPKTATQPVVEKPKEVAKVTETPVAKETKEEIPETNMVKETPKKKVVSNVVKPRKSKDSKACRQPCYGSADEDLNLFFKDNMPMTRKQRRKAKNSMANVRLQLHFDGSIKKVIVTGASEEFNLKVQDVIKMMNNWNAAVKNGLTVKAEVKFTLKYDKATKSMKPFDIVMNPRLPAKCKCVSDSELFGSND
jgi:hypothetical protein